LAKILSGSSCVSQSWVLENTVLQGYYNLKTVFGAVMYRLHFAFTGSLQFAFSVALSVLLDKVSQNVMSCDRASAYEYSPRVPVTRTQECRIHYCTVLVSMADFAVDPLRSYSSPFCIRRYIRRYISPFSIFPSDLRRELPSEPQVNSQLNSLVRPQVESQVISLPTIELLQNGECSNYEILGF
jgi:hypothetical protein